VSWIPEGEGAGMTMCWGVATEECIVYTAFVTVSKWIVAVVMVVVSVEVSSPLGVRCEISFLGSSGRSGDADRSVWLGKAARVRTGGRALLWPTTLKDKKNVLIITLFSLLWNICKCPKPKHLQCIDIKDKTLQNDSHERSCNHDCHYWECLSKIIGVDHCSAILCTLLK